ncbi:hypothetical protein CYLTODRAFT_418679 [Cylindrobasidium torrendii FP15055 ss-10]|uniref:BZIP domain-containing protein n=1 Tax=Cylindrobasidium torrendii FP15055 ss-10 TaxID=1314674 RepID=A0A0D7BN61_9AGAR|nr:hypothetical protein CYLTODRAFT_418679 [Cylindrobasidium torrendii FP15055 ss-10]
MPKDMSAAHNSQSESPQRSTTDSERRRRNASAQAQFRARRANYISTLEETVTNLESVVLQLQESNRDSRNEIQEVRHENIRLRQAWRDREELWRAMWPRSSHGSELDAPMPPPLPQFMHATPSSTPVSATAPQYGVAQHVSPATSVYRSPDEPPPQYAQASSGYLDGTEDPQAEYAQYYGSVGAADPSQKASPHYAPSPTLLSPAMSHPASRYETKGNGMSGTGPLDPSGAPYAFPASRSASTTPPAISSYGSLASGGYSGYDNGGQERGLYDYRPQTQDDMVLHGGTADIPLAAPPVSQPARYRSTMGSQRHAENELPAPLAAVPPLALSDKTGSPHEGGSDDGGANIYPSASQRLRTRRGGDAVLGRHSRSPSPDSGAPLSGTLAVIKAQAFGALRRTRARSKKTDSAQVAIDVLESRGIGTDVGQPPTKRQRLSGEFRSNPHSSR